MKKGIPVSTEYYAGVSAKMEEGSAALMVEKSKGYSADDDFLAMQNRIASLTGLEPETVSFVLGMKHIASLALLLEKNEGVSLAKWDERVQDAMNLLKICSCFVYKKFGITFEKDEE